MTPKAATVPSANRLLPVAKAPTAQSKTITGRMAARGGRAQRETGDPDHGAPQRDQMILAMMKMM
jgi:hypothetical protein